MVYKGRSKTYDFRKFKTIQTFGNSIRTNFINMYTANDKQSYLAKYIKSKTRPKHASNLKKVKEDELNSAKALLRGRKMVFKAFLSGIFSKLNFQGNIFCMYAEE